MEIRYVEWIDSSGIDGWAPLAQLRANRPHRCRSVGFVLAETDDCVMLLQSLDDQDNDEAHGDHGIAIPKFAITKSRTLRR